MPKILIVDDEVDITDTCVMYLESNGYEAYGAKNSKEAFEIVKKHKPDILILDINLREEYTGNDVLKKAMEANPKAQAAMLTGMGDYALLKEAKELGAKHIIQKPIVITQLRETIDEFIKNIS